MVDDYKEETRILYKYKNGHIISQEDRMIVERLSSIGLIKKGVSLIEKENTAKTTEMGLMIIDKDPRHKKYKG